MNATENTVTMALNSYNAIKTENTKFQMFVSRLFEDAELRSDYSGIEFDGKKLEDLIHLCYPDMYKKKLSALRAQQTKMSLKELSLNKPVEAERQEDEKEAE